MKGSRNKIIRGQFHYLYLETRYGFYGAGSEHFTFGIHELSECVGPTMNILGRFI